MTLVRQQCDSTMHLFEIDPYIDNRPRGRLDMITRSIVHQKQTSLQRTYQWTNLVSARSLSERLLRFQILQLSSLNHIQTVRMFLDHRTAPAREGLLLPPRRHFHTTSVHRNQLASLPRQLRCLQLYRYKTMTRIPRPGVASVSLCDYVRHDFIFSLGLLGFLK